MSQGTRLLLAAVLFAIGTGGAVAFATADAQPGSIAVCVDRITLYVDGTTGSAQIQTWMNQQLATGRSHFFSADKDSVLCVW